MVRCAPRTAPEIPRTPISRATWSRPIRWPACRIACQILRIPVDPPIAFEDREDGVGGVRLSQRRLGDRTGILVCVVRGPGDRHAVLGEHAADRVDPEHVSIIVDVLDEYRSRRSTSAAAKNADAVFKISLALRNSAFSLRRALSSAETSELAAALLGCREERRRVYRQAPSLDSPSYSFSRS